MTATEIDDLILEVAEEYEEGADIQLLLHSFANKIIEACHKTD